MRHRFLPTVLLPALLLGASAAQAIEYSAPGDPAKIRVFDAITDTLVCHSYVNSCDLIPGVYTVKIFDTRSEPASSIIRINLASEGEPAPDADTLGALACSQGEVAKFIGGAWTCAADADSTPDVVDILTLLEGYFCSDGETLLRDGDTGAIACNAEYTCPYDWFVNQGPDYELSEPWIDEPGRCGAIFTLKEPPAITDGSIVYYTTVQVGVYEDIIEADYLGPVRESTQWEPIGDRNTGRACAIELGCSRY